MCREAICGRRSILGKRWAWGAAGCLAGDSRYMSEQAREGGGQGPAHPGLDGCGSYHFGFHSERM